MVVKLPGGKNALRRLLLRDQAALMHELFWRPMLNAGDGSETAVTPEKVFGERHEVLANLLAAHDFALLRDLVRQAGDKAIRALLAGHDDALYACLAADGHALFRHLARSADHAPLKATLFDDDYRVLRDLLSRQGHAALKAIVLDREPAWFSMLVRAREARPLARELFRDDAALLHAACRVQGDSALVPILQKDGRRYLGALPREARHDLTRQMVVEGGASMLDHLLDDPQFADRLASAPRAEAVIALARKWEALAGVVEQADRRVQARYREAMQAIRSPEHLRGRVLDAITDGDLAYLAHGTLQFPCRHSLWTLIHEILLNEDYYFESETDTPRIIDGGAHMGMAIYYFKTLYPDARITAFEPEPSLHALAEANVARNGWRDVDVLPCALAAEPGAARFYTSPQWSMAGALSDHRTQFGEALKEIEVECVPLSDYLDEPVDFLKLDIEGAETEVLEEAAPKLGNVRHLFCEFHQGPGFPSGRIAKILGILEEAGFDVQIAKSHNYGETSRHRPITHLGGSASQIIWARRKA